MSYSTDIVGIVTSTTSVNVPTLTVASLTLIGTTSDPKTGSMKTVYRLASGDQRYPLLVTFQVTPQKTGGCRGSVAINTFVSVTNSVTGEIGYTPISTYFAINVPDALLDLADLAVLVGNTFMMLAGTVTTGTPNWQGVSNLMFGIPKP